MPACVLYETVWAGGRAGPAVGCARGVSDGRPGVGNCAARVRKRWWRGRHSVVCCGRVSAGLAAAVVCACERGGLAQDQPPGVGTGRRHGRTEHPGGAARSARGLVAVTDRVAARHVTARARRSRGVHAGAGRRRAAAARVASVACAVAEHAWWGRSCVAGPEAHASGHGSEPACRSEKDAVTYSLSVELALFLAQPLWQSVRMRAHAWSAGKVD